MVDHLFPPSNAINLFPLTMKNSMLKHRIFTTGKFEIDNPKIFYLYWTKNIFVPSEMKVATQKTLMLMENQRLTVLSNGH